MKCNVAKIKKPTTMKYSTCKNTKQFCPIHDNLQFSWGFFCKEKLIFTTKTIFFVLYPLKMNFYQSFEP